ncbi:MAG: enoyl-CoA hydratase/isomerase family protein [Pseudomonadota bacterium]
MTDPVRGTDRNRCSFTLQRSAILAEIILSSESGLNLLTPESLGALESICRELATDSEIRVVVLRSTGRHFCGGLDLSSHRAVVEDDTSLMEKRRLSDLGSRTIEALIAIPQPTICALHGATVGGGAGIAAACDFRIAARSATFGYPEILRGMNLAWHSVAPCVRLVGPARAKRLIMFGRLEPVTLLAEWGLVDELVDDDDLTAAVKHMAEELAALPPLGVQMVKRSVNAIVGPLDAAIMHMDGDQFLLAARSDDGREAIDAFAEKRLPSYRGN